MINDDKFKEYYKKGWETDLIMLCDQKLLKKSHFKFRLMAVVDFLDASYYPECKILDVGCGVGTTSILILQKYNNVNCEGIDISDKQIQCGKHYVEGRGIGDRFNFIAYSGDIGHLIRRNPATQSGGFRPAVPGDSGRPVGAERRWS